MLLQLLCRFAFEKKNFALSSLAGCCRRSFLDGKLGLQIQQRKRCRHDDNGAKVRDIFVDVRCRRVTRRSGALLRQPSTANSVFAVSV